LTQVPQSAPGLVRVIGRWSLTALMVNSIIGGGIFGLPSLLAAKVGALSPLSCVIAGAGILTIAACIAEVSSRYEETGGLYLYARDAFGRFASLVVAWLTWLTRIAAPAAVANLFCIYLARFFPALGSRKGTLLVLAALISQLALFNYVGVKTGNIVSNVSSVVKVSFLLLFVIAGLLALLLHPQLRVPFTLPPITTKNWFDTILLLVFAYGGFEGALFVGGETKDPKRDMPMALLVALGIVCVIYTAVQFVTIATLPGAAVSATPLSDAAQRFLGPAGAAVIGIAALLSGYGYLSANLLHAPRIMFALAEHGDFPAFLGAIHPKYRTPYISILVYAVVLFIFSALGSFQWNAMLSAASRLGIYGAMALAMLVLRQRRDGKAQFQLPFPYFFSALALVFSFVLLMRMGRGELYIVAATCGIALLNGRFARRLTHENQSG
jgi:basic amino acid/polyamine antiporter, APA family